MSHPPFSPLPPQIIEGLSFEEYQNLPAASSHGLMDLLKSPAHYLANRLSPHESTPAMELGRRIHLRVLEQVEWRRRVKVYPDFGEGKGSRTAKWDWEEKVLAEVPDAVLIKQSECDMIDAIARQLHSCPVVGNLLGDGRSEVTLTWTDADTGLACKARVDHLLRRHGKRVAFLDLKKTVNASPERFPYEAWKYRYHIQGAHYVEGGKAVLGEEPLFVLVAIETEPPYCHKAYVVDEGFLDMGLQLRNRSMKRLRRCLDEGSFPGYGATVANLALPHSAFYEFQDEDLS